MRREHGESPPFSFFFFFLVTAGGCGSGEKKDKRIKKKDVASLCGLCGTNAGANAATAALMRGDAAEFVRGAMRGCECVTTDAGHFHGLHPVREQAHALCVISWADAESHGVVHVRA